LIEVKIGENPPHPFYVPKDLAKAGFTGKVEILADTKTITILHPNASLDEIAESLAIRLKDINLRRGLKTIVTTEDISKKHKKVVSTTVTT